MEKGNTFERPQAEYDLEKHAPNTLFLWRKRSGYGESRPSGSARLVQQFFEMDIVVLILHNYSKLKERL